MRDTTIVASAYKPGCFVSRILSREETDVRSSVIEQLEDAFMGSSTGSCRNNGSFFFNLDAMSYHASDHSCIRLLSNGEHLGEAVVCSKGSHWLSLLAGKWAVSHWAVAVLAAKVKRVEGEVAPSQVKEAKEAAWPSIG